jgi:hypothetical protein
MPPEFPESNCPDCGELREWLSMDVVDGVETVKYICRDCDETWEVTA